LKNFIEQNKKVLILGDSFTFGWLINDQNTFIHKFQKENLDYNFINVAVGAWGSSHYTLFTELFCKNIMPQEIVVFLNSDDFYRGYNAGFYKIIEGKLIKTNKKVTDIQGDSKLDKMVPFYKFFKSNSHLFMLARNTAYNLINKPVYNEWSPDRYWPRPSGEFDYNYSSKVFNFNKKVFLRLKKISTECNASLNILNLMWSDHRIMEDTNPNKLFLKNAKDFFMKNNINYFENKNKMTELYKNPMKYIIDIDFHPNEAGVELIYLSLNKEIKKILSN